MFSAKSTTFLFLMTFLFCFPAVLGDIHVCLQSQTFAADRPYSANLHELLSYLSGKTPPMGFGLGSKGEGQDRAYGLALCRADLSPANCSDCLSQVTNEVLSRCPYNKGGAIWNGGCQLKYSNTDFFCQVDDANRYYQTGSAIARNSSSFDRDVMNILSKLAEQASGEHRMAATGELEFEGSEKIFVLAQCTRDLSAAACKSCLLRSISAIPHCCSGKIEATLTSGTCDVRYGRP